jgi:hypothetical protein
MTTKNRAIRIGGMMGNIQGGGVVINSHRSTSCGLTAVAQGNWTNEHTLQQFTQRTGVLQSILYGTRRGRDSAGSHDLRKFLKKETGERRVVDQFEISAKRAHPTGRGQWCRLLKYFKRSHPCSPANFEARGMYPAQSVARIG